MLPGCDSLGRMNTPGMARLRAMRLAKDAMDRDWADSDLDLDAVAAYAGYSRYHFVRAFKAAYGETPGQYLSRRRIERAEELLRSANLSVTEICMLVGFTSLGTFSARLQEADGHEPQRIQAAARAPGGGDDPRVLRDALHRRLQVRRSGCGEERQRKATTKRRQRSDQRRAQQRRSRPSSALTR